MSRFSVLLHRILGRWQPIAEEVLDDVFGPFASACLNHPDYTAKDRRDLALNLVTNYIARKAPGYEWAIRFIVDSLIAQYEKKH